MVWNWVSYAESEHRRIENKTPMLELTIRDAAKSGRGRFQGEWMRCRVRCVCWGTSCWPRVCGEIAIKENESTVNQGRRSRESSQQDREDDKRVEMKRIADRDAEISTKQGRPSLCFVRRRLEAEVSVQSVGEVVCAMRKDFT